MSQTEALQAPQASAQPDVQSFLNRSRVAVVERSIERAGVESRGLIHSLEGFKLNQSDVAGLVNAEHGLKTTQELKEVSREAASLALDHFTGSAKTAVDICSNWLADAELKSKVDDDVSKLNQCCAPIVRPPNSPVNGVVNGVANGSVDGVVGDSNQSEALDLDRSIDTAKHLSGEINRDLQSMRSQFEVSIATGERNTPVESTEINESTHPGHLPNVEKPNGRR